MNNRYAQAITFILLSFACSPMVEAQATYSKPTKVYAQPVRRAPISVPPHRPIVSYGGYVPTRGYRSNLNSYPSSASYRYYLPPTATSCVDLTTAVYYPPDPPPPSYNPPGDNGTVDDGDGGNMPPPRGESDSR